jgi:hypothetical protein
MQVGIGRVGVAGAADEGDGLAAVHDGPFRDPSGVTIQMGVIPPGLLFR